MQYQEIFGWTPVFDDAAPGNEGSDKGKETPKTFTQDDVNRMMAEHKRSLAAKNNELAEQLEQARKQSGLTAEERDTLNTRIEQLQTEMLSKDELSKREREKSEKQLKKQLEDVTKERDGWKNRYTSSTIEQALTDAAVAHKAISPRQIIALMRGNTSLTEDGRVMTKLDTVDADKKPVTLELSASDAIKQMRDMEEYLNLFQGEGTGGIGGNTRSAGKSADVKTLATDPAAYRKARASGQIKF